MSKYLKANTNNPEKKKNSVLTIYTPISYYIYLYFYFLTLYVSDPSITNAL